MNLEELTAEVALLKQQYSNLGFELMQTNQDLSKLLSQGPESAPELQAAIQKRLQRLRTIVFKK